MEKTDGAYRKMESDIPGKDFYDKKNKLKDKFPKVVSSLPDEI